MSTDKAIAAVTKTLQSHLFKQLSKDPDLAGATVTTKPPDKARPDTGAGRQLNLFLFQTSIDAAWRNQAPAGTGVDAQPALPVVLSYLLTAYGDNDDEVESHQILGLAMSSFNDQPLLSRAEISTAFPGSDLENQVERVRITPHPVPMNEISWLWATFQTGYRISVTYDVSVVLIDSAQRPAPGPAVLARGDKDSGPIATTVFPPFITKVVAPNGMPAARPGDAVALEGKNFAGATTVQVSGPWLADPQTLTLSDVTDTTATLTIPSAGTQLPAGTVLLTPTTTPPQAPANTVALRLAPALTLKKAPQKALAGGAASVAVTFTPPAVAGQPTALVVGDRIVAGPTPTAPTTSLTFELTGFSAGRYQLRLRIDDQESIPVDPKNPQAYDPNQYLVLT